MQKNDEVQVVLRLRNVSWSKRVNGSFYLSVSCGKIEQRSKEYQIPEPGAVTSIEENLNFKYMIKKNIIGQRKKQVLKYVLNFVDGAIVTKVGTWKKDITHPHTLETSEVIKVLDSQNFGKISISYSLIYATGLMSCKSTTKLGMNPASRASKSSSLILEVKEYESFFINNKPERILNAPAFALHLSREVERKEPIEVILEELQIGGEGNLETQIYTLVSGLQLISIIRNKRLLDNSMLEIVRLVLISIFKRTCQNLLEQKADEIESQTYEEFGRNICTWLIEKIGSGLFCQQIFTGILFSLACSFKKSEIPIMCSNFGVSEKKFLSLAAFIPEDHDAIYEMIAEVVFPKY